MAIGTMAAIGLGLGAVGSVASGMSANSAAGKAADTSLAVAEKNNALTREMYGKNEANLTPYMNTGNAAMGQINALLGLQTAAPAPAALPSSSPISNSLSPQQAIGNAWGSVLGRAPTSGAPAGYGAYVQANPDLMAEYQHVAGQFGNDINAYGQYHWNTYGQREGRPAPAMPGAAPAAPTPSSVDAQKAAENAFGQYRNSTGYQFRLGEGVNALNSSFAGRGVGQSGAAMKGAVEYGQNFASGEFGNYLNALGNQQGLGMQGASALAGVGQNMVNSITANNNSAGSAAANAILAKGANNPFGNALGMLGGGLYGLGR